MTPLHHGQYVHLDVLPNGDLRVTLTPEGLLVAPAVVTILNTPVNDDDALAFLTNPNGDCQDFIFIEDISKLDGGHLSQSPCIVTDWDYATPDMNLEPYVEYTTGRDSKVWYWNSYMIISILEHIKRQGEAVLNKL